MNNQKKILDFRKIIAKYLDEEENRYITQNGEKYLEINYQQFEQKLKILKNQVENPINDLPELIQKSDIYIIDPNKKLKLTIIGITGTNKGEGKFCTLDNIQKMVTYMEKIIIESKVAWENVEFNCSDSIFTEQVLIILSLNYKCKINLYLECDFNNGSFIDDELVRKHNYISRKSGINSLNNIDNILKLESTKSFVVREIHNRSKLLSKADKLIVFKININSSMDENTSNIYNNFNKDDRHIISINNLEMIKL